MNFFLLINVKMPKIVGILTFINRVYYILINDTSFELSVFWPSDTESQINELRFFDSISLSFKTRLKLVSCFTATLRQVNFLSMESATKKMMT